MHAEGACWLIHVKKNKQTNTIQLALERHKAWYSRKKNIWMLVFYGRGTLQAPQYTTNIKEHIFPSLPQIWWKKYIALMLSQLIWTSRNFSQNPIISCEVHMIEIFKTRNYFCYHLQLNFKSNFTFYHHIVPTLLKIFLTSFLKKVAVEYKTRK